MVYAISKCGTKSVKALDMVSLRKRLTELREIGTYYAIDGDCAVESQVYVTAAGVVETRHFRALTQVGLRAALVQRAFTDAEYLAHIVSVWA
jgi:hypothetical protein